MSESKVKQGDKINNKKPLGKRTVMKSISNGLMSHIERLAKMVAKGSRNEEETRRWVVDVLRTGFGYTDDQIETEMKALGKRVDIAIKSKGKVLLVIECKASSVKLNDSSMRQATNYAAALGAEWAAVTNGQKWELYHVTPMQGEEPAIDQIFEIELLAEELTNEHAELLYLLTEKALVSGDTLKSFHFTRCTDYEKIKNILVTDDDIASMLCKKLRESYLAQTGVLIEKDLTTGFIKDMLQVILLSAEED